jgi:hypothetical protein
MESAPEAEPEPAPEPAATLKDQTRKFSLNIRQGRREDAAQVLAYIHELAEFEKEADQVGRGATSTHDYHLPHCVGS